MKKINKVTGMNEKQKEVFRKPIVKEIQKLVKKFGEERVKYSCNWFFIRVSARRSREKKVKELRKQISSLKKGKMPDYY